MSISTSHWDVESELQFATPGNGPVVVNGVDLALDRQDGVLCEARLTFTASPAVYARIESEGLFNLTPESRGPGAATFEPESEVQIEARLEDALLVGLGAMGGNILESGPRFSALASDSPLLESENWYALTVTVEVMRDADGGVLREGYSTAYARAPQPWHSMLATAAEALEARGLEWHETSDDEVIRLDVSSDNGAWACYVVGREEDHRCTIYSQAPWETPVSRLGEMAELLTRINFGLPVGNFELDFSDGEIRFKTSIDLAGAHLTAELFDGLFEPNIATMDVYLPALEAVRDGRLSPQAAEAMVEES